MKESSRAFNSYFFPTSSNTVARRPEIVCIDRAENVNIEHLERIVTGILYNSVVHSIKMQCSGGSSIVLRRASNAFFERLCASSIIYIFFGSIDGRYEVELISSFMSAIVLCDAASSSIKSIVFSSRIIRQFLQ